MSEVDIANAQKSSANARAVASKVELDAANAQLVLFQNGGYVAHRAAADAQSAAAAAVGTAGGYVAQKAAAEAELAVIRARNLGNLNGLILFIADGHL